MATTPRIELDMLVQIGGRALAIELKYPRAALAIEIGDDAYDLRLGAADVESYAVVKDLWRLERLIREGIAEEGCAVVLTNNPAIWRASSTGRETLGDAFRLTDGTTMSGLRSWRPNEKTWPGPPIELTGSYDLSWSEYATVPADRGAREFRRLVIPVGDSTRAADALAGDAVAQPLAAHQPAVGTAPADAPFSTGERGLALAVKTLEAAGYAVACDQQRSRRLIVSKTRATATVWVAARKDLNYPFWVKSDWEPDPHTFACLVRLPATGKDEVYVIPTAVWAAPDGVFVSRDYPGLSSPPEWGINLSKRNLPALAQYLMPAAATLLP